jgi:hypothetical protein
VDRVRAVGFEGGAALEFHHAAKLVSLRARGDIFADPGFEQAGDASLEFADFSDNSLLLFLRDVRLPAEDEGVDDHSGILMALSQSLNAPPPEAGRCLFG